MIAAAHENHQMASEISSQTGATSQPDCRIGRGPVAGWAAGA